MRRILKNPQSLICETFNRDRIIITPYLKMNFRHSNIKEFPDLVQICAYFLHIFYRMCVCVCDRDLLHITINKKSDTYDRSRSNQRINEPINSSPLSKI